MTAQAPDRWEDLLPAEWETVPEYVEVGRGYLNEERRRIREAAEQRQAKIQDGLRGLGISKQNGSA